MTTKLLLISLCFASTAHATATYDVQNAVTIQFSQVWTSVAPNTVPSKNPDIGPGISQQYAEGSGVFTAHSGSSTVSDTDLFLFTQIDAASGSAGNQGLDQGGFSSSGSYTYNLFTFDFGNTPTDFSITLLEWDYSFGYHMDAPPKGDLSGDYLGGSVGYQFVMDDSGAGINYADTTHVFEGLTGLHEFRFGTFAETNATAIYPYRVPENGSTSPLLLLGLACLPLYKAVRMKGAGDMPRWTSSSENGAARRANGPWQSAARERERQ
jgi:hypothetical protein